MVKADDKTFQNVGLQVGMGGFTFTVAYAANDGGAYKVAKADRAVNQVEFDAGKGVFWGVDASIDLGSGVVTDTTGTVGATSASRADDLGNNYSVLVDASGADAGDIVAVSSTTVWAANSPGYDADNNTIGTAQSGYAWYHEGEAWRVNDQGNTDASDDVVELDPSAAGRNDTANDNPMLRLDKIVDDKSMNWDTWGASVKYSEGAMAVSLSHLATEWDDGGEQEASMLSVSYTLAPGVASKSSIFTAERSFANGREIEGTGFVTGITVGF